jgi:SPP1 gp7 family putative phage head morphogenesis protein
LLLELWRSKIAEIAGTVKNSTLPDEGWWNQFQQEQLEIIQPWIERLALIGVRRGQLALDTEQKALVPQAIINWQMINQAAIGWALTYAYDLVGGIVRTTRDKLAGALSDWLQSNQAFPALLEKVNEIFDDPRRAEMIAVTETTRVIAEGNTLAWNEAGVWGREWRTARDELVCPICGPLHKQRQPMGNSFETTVRGKHYVIANPPAHPRCRCTVVPVINEPT